MIVVSRVVVSLIDMLVPHCTGAYVRFFMLTTGIDGGDVSKESLIDVIELFPEKLIAWCPIAKISWPIVVALPWLNVLIPRFVPSNLCRTGVNSILVFLMLAISRLVCCQVQSAKLFAQVWSLIVSRHLTDAQGLYLFDLFSFRSLNTKELSNLTGRDVAGLTTLSRRKSAHLVSTKSFNNLSPSTVANDAYLSFMSVEDMFKISFLKYVNLNKPNN
jgi:hypothetical protein